MKRSYFVLLLILLFAVNNFSQMKSPNEVVNEFWNLALKNDFDTAKKQINLPLFNKEKLESLKQVFQTVSTNEMKITKFEKEEILQISAVFVFKVKGKDGQEILARIRLIKSLNTWQVLSLETFAEVLVETDTVFVQSLPIEPKKQNDAQILPLEPYNEKKNPVTFLGKPYTPDNYIPKIEYKLPKIP